MHLVCDYIPTALVCVFFIPIIPTYFFNLFNCFLYLFALFFKLRVICMYNEQISNVQLVPRGVHGQ